MLELNYGDNSQSMFDPKYFKRKENLVIKDFESAFKCYEKLLGKIANIRQWTVTVMVALIVFTLTSKDFSLKDIIATVIICFCAFLILELRERSSMKFDKSVILEMERIFMIQDNDKYETEINEFKFRDLRLTDITRRKKCVHLLRSLFKTEVLFWYVTWMFIWLFIIMLKFDCAKL